MSNNQQQASPEKVRIEERLTIQEIKDIGFAVTAQTSNLCPLDKVIYALRDVTGTVASIPLIAAHSR